MIQTLSIHPEEMNRYAPEIKWVMNNIDKKIFVDNFDHFKLWEYMRCFEEIDNKYSARTVPAITMIDVGSCRSWFPFFVAHYYTCGSIWATDTEPPETYFYNGMPDVRPNLYYNTCYADRLVDEFGEGSVDVVTCISVIEHIDKEFDALKKMSQILRSGGILLLTTDFDYNSKPDLFRRYDDRMLTERVKYLQSCGMSGSYCVDIPNLEAQKEVIERNKEYYRNWKPEWRSFFAYNDLPYLSCFGKFVKQ